MFGNKFKKIFLIFIIVLMFSINIFCEENNNNLKIQNNSDKISNLHIESVNFYFLTKDYEESETPKINLNKWTYAEIIVASQKNFKVSDISVVFKLIDQETQEYIYLDTYKSFSNKKIEKIVSVGPERYVGENDGLDEETRALIEKENEKSRQLNNKEYYAYKETIYIEEHMKDIEKYFGKDYINKNFVLEISLLPEFYEKITEDIYNKRIDYKKYFISIDNLKEPPYKEGIAQPEFGIATLNKKELGLSRKISSSSEVKENVAERYDAVAYDEIPIDVVKEVKKIKKNDNLQIRSVSQTSDVLQNELTKEIYVSNKNNADEVKILKPVKSVLISNGIEISSVVEPPVLISVQDNLEYMVKVKTKRKLFWFIPFGYKKEYIFLKATEDVIVED